MSLAAHSLVKFDQEDSKSLQLLNISDYEPVPGEPCSKSTMTRKQMRRISSSRAIGRLDRSTGVHQRAQAVAVDRPVDRLTLPTSRLGTVDRCLGRSTDRSTDRRIRADSGSFLD